MFALGLGLDNVPQLGLLRRNMVKAQVQGEYVATSYETIQTCVRACMCLRANSTCEPCLRANSTCVP
jgi:hypothetical protein